MHFPERRFEIRLCAEGGYVPRAEFAPVGENGRKRGPDFVRAQPEKTAARSVFKRVLQAPGQGRIQAGCLNFVRQDETAVRS
jgi:hypothetical protein